MKKIHSLICIFTPLVFLLPIYSPAQENPRWIKTAYTPSPASRINDGFFLTPSLGWVVNGVGQIHKTTDAGATWSRVLTRSGTHFRSVGFLDPLHGWAGCLGIGDPNNPSSTDQNILYRSTDGGTTWTPVTALSGPTPRGFCGMHVLNDTVINAVGRVRGPATFYRTIDAGNTWEATDMSPHAAGLIDVYFFSPDTGIAVGLTNAIHDNSSGVILFTSDAGKTWEKRFTTTRVGEWCWKLSFPSRNVGYVSLQRNSLSPIYFLKTTDGGATWSEKLFRNAWYFVQGIGFANESVGWIGGWSGEPMYETRNGGESWSSIGIGRRVNRFRMFNESSGYAVGDSVYKYGPLTPVGILADAAERSGRFAVAQNFPNPFNPSTIIHVDIPEEAFVSVRVFNMLGQEVITLINQVRSPGVLAVEWDGVNEEGERLPSGSYLYHVRMRSLSGHGTYGETKRMVMVR
ncbi:MAG: T9SS type A sorting domain-containing protein [Ignavibacteriales bacterium]|nr:T9SS type A sorting domain-containing protein [Ignavibacteriales bacterium]